MQSLQRYSQEGGGNNRRSGGRDPPRGRRGAYGGSADLYQPLDQGNGTGLCEDSFSSGRHRRSCCRTSGAVFNVLVAVVLIANTILIGIETDTGLLGTDSVRWTGLDGDLHVLGADYDQRHGLQTALQSGVSADASVKEGLERKVNQTLKRDILRKQDGRLLDSGAYTSWEYLFLAFFILELFVRMCDVGCKSYCSDPWRFLDLSIVVLGVADLFLPYFAGPNPSWMALTSLSCLRIARTLRVMRLIRLCPELKVISGAYGKAFAAVLWVGLLIVVLDFILAVILTSAIGTKAHLWDEKAEDIEHWFGSLGRSMSTLFGLMTLTGWDHLAQVLGEVLPDAVVVPCLVFYVLLVSFTTLGLINGVISDTFLRAQCDRERKNVLKAERHRVAFAKGLTNILSSCQQNRNGYLNRDGFKMALEAHPIVFTRLRQLDVYTNVDELLQLFDRLCQDSQSDVAVEIESLVEAIALLSASAKASEVFDLKYLVLAMRRETAERSSQIQYEVTQRHEDQAGILNTTNAKVTKAQQELTQVKQDVASARQELAALQDELQKVQKRAEKDEREHRTALAAVSDKVDVLAVVSEKVDVLALRIASQEGALHEKVDALTAQVAAQADPEALLSKFAADFAAQFSAQFAAQIGAAGSKAAASAASAEEPETAGGEASHGDAETASAKPSGEPQSELIDLESTLESEPAAASASASTADTASKQS